MIRKLQIQLWSFVMELEYMLYPWKTREPPDWAIKRFNLHHGIVDEVEDSLYYDWIKAHDQKIDRLQSEMIYAQNEIKRLTMELADERSK